MALDAQFAGTLEAGGEVAVDDARVARIATGVDRYVAARGGLAFTALAPAEDDGVPDLAVVGFIENTDDLIAAQIKVGLGIKAHPSTDTEALEHISNVCRADHRIPRPVGEDIIQGVIEEIEGDGIEGAVLEVFDQVGDVFGKNIEVQEHIDQAVGSGAAEDEFGRVCGQDFDHLDDILDSRGQGVGDIEGVVDGVGLPDKGEVIKEGDLDGDVLAVFNGRVVIGAAVGDVHFLGADFCAGDAKECEALPVCDLGVDDRADITVGVDDCRWKLKEGRGRRAVGQVLVFDLGTGHGGAEGAGDDLLRSCFTAVGIFDDISAAGFGADAEVELQGVDIKGFDKGFDTSGTHIGGRVVFGRGEVNGGDTVAIGDGPKGREAASLSTVDQLEIEGDESIFDGLALSVEELDL